MSSLLRAIGAFLACGMLLGVDSDRIRAAEAQVPPAVPTVGPKLVIDSQGFTSPVVSVDFSPRGDLLAAAGSDKVVRIWEVESGKLRATLRGYDDNAGNGQCNAVRFAPDGRSLLVGVKDFSSAGAIRVYDTSDYTEIQALLPGHANGGVNELAFSSDGRYLASGGSDGGIIFWDWPARRAIGEVPWTPNLAYFGFPTSIALFVVYDAQGFHAFSPPHVREIGQIPPAQLATLADPSVVGAAYRTAQSLGPSLGQIEASFPYRGQATTNRIYPRGGQRAEDLVLFGGTGKKDGSDTYWVGLWTTGGRAMRVYESHPYSPTALALNPDGSLVASADRLGNIDLWETATGRRRVRLAGRGQAVYSAGFDAAGARLVFGTEPYGPDRWGYNSYAATNRAFDLNRRTLAQSTEPPRDAPSLRRTVREVRFQFDPGPQIYRFTNRRQGAAESTFPLSPGVVPLCFGYLGSTRTGIADLLMLGCQDNTLTGIDPADVFRSRAFIGHTGAVNACGASPDGRFLASGSSDRTLRLWSLDRVDDQGWPDFFTYANGLVYYIKPGGSAERAGVKLGDAFVKIGGRDMGTVFDRRLAGKRDYLPGQRVEVELTRAGVAYRANVDLVPSGDFVFPTLNLFVDGDEWVLWTPSGYYDSSPGGDRLIGWHVNRGRDKSARYYAVHQFRKQFFRPDVIDKVLETGDPARAVALANQVRPHGSQALDLRKSEDLRRVEPPTVTMRAPRADTHAPGRSIQVRADVVSQNGGPIGVIRVLVNGRSVTGKDVPLGPGDTATSRHIVVDVDLDPGRNTISVLATDRNARSTSQPQEIVVHSQDRGDEEREKPRAFVLAVGISNYKNPKYNLEFAHVDAQSFAASWSAQSDKLYQKVATRVLVNERASVSAIREGFDWLNANVGPNDFAVIFFAAHGVGDPASGYYIASHDIDPKRLISTAIPDRDLVSVAEGLRSRRTLVFLDTCHAGGIEHARRNTSETMQELTSDEVGAVMFGACKPREESQEDAQWGHGAFTKALLDAFGDPATDLPPFDGLLSMDELVYAVGRRVPALTQGEQHPIMNRPPTIENFDLFAFVARKPGRTDGADSAADAGRLRDRLAARPISE